MPTTSPDDIAYPDGSWTQGLRIALSTMATSIQAAFSRRARYTYRWPTQVERDAEVDMRIDDTGYQVDNDTSYRFNGTIWVVTAVSGRVRPFVAAIITRTTAQSVASSSAVMTVVTLDTTLLNSGEFTLASGVLTCVTAGTYKFTTWVEYAGNNAGVRFLEFQKALAATPSTFVTQREGHIPSGASSFDISVTVIGIVTVVVGNKLQLGTRQNSGSALNVVNAGLELSRIS